MHIIHIVHNKTCGYLFLSTSQRFSAKIDLYTNLSTLSTFLSTNSLFFQKGIFSFTFCILLINLFFTEKNTSKTLDFFWVSQIEMQFIMDFQAILFWAKLQIIVGTFWSFWLNFSNMCGILKTSQKKELWECVIRLLEEMWMWLRGFGPPLRKNWKAGSLFQSGYRGNCDTQCSERQTENRGNHPSQRQYYPALKNPAAICMYPSIWWKRLSNVRWKNIKTNSSTRNSQLGLLRSLPERRGSCWWRDLLSSKRFAMKPMESGRSLCTDGTSGPQFLRIPECRDRTGKCSL